MTGVKHSLVGQCNTQARNMHDGLAPAAGHLPTDLTDRQADVHTSKVAWYSILHMDCLLQVWRF